MKNLLFSRLNISSNYRGIPSINVLLNFPKNLHSNTGTGDYFPKKVISS